MSKVRSMTTQRGGRVGSSRLGLSHRVCLLVSASFLFLSSICTAEANSQKVKRENPYKEIAVSTPVYYPDFSNFNPKLGQYRYVVDWQGIPAAEAIVDVKQEGLKYLVNIDVSTNDFIDVFYKLRYKSEATFSAVDLRPLEHTIIQTENSKKKETKLRFLEDGTVEAKRWKNGKPIQDLSFDADNFMLDPISAAFLARSLSWKKGDVRQFDTYNGKSRYLIDLKADDEILMKINGTDTAAWVIVPQVRKVEEAHSHKKLKSAKIYVTADEQREVVKLTSKVFVGSVNTTLKSFTPAPSPPMGPQLAQMRAQLKERANQF